ncbi:MAG TPA: thioredoxin family protein [Bacteroidales bacterium]
MKRLILFFGITVASFAVINAQGYKVGDKASDFKLKNIDGKYVSLSDFSKAKGFMVIFTCNHCPYAQAYQDRIIQLDKKFKPLGYPVIAINSNDPQMEPTDSYQAMIVRAKEKGYTFPYLFDETQNVYREYGAKRTPHVFLLQKQGDGLVVKYVGAIDDNYQDPGKVTDPYLANAVNALLEGHEPNPSFTKAIGCSIKDKQYKAN